MPDLYDRRDKKTKLPLPIPEDRVGFGTRFEEALEPQLAAKYQGYRPGEFAVQHAADCVHSRTKVRVGDLVCPCGAGIIYSPDYLFMVPKRDTILGEFKLTWYSSREFPDHRKFQKWLTQIKFYLHNLKLTTTWVFPFWVNGGTDHRYQEVQPEFKRAYELQFSAGECEQTHQRLIKHAVKHKLMEPYFKEAA